MNHCVPDFEIQMDEDEEFPIPISSSFPRPKKPSMKNDETMELLWQNGQVVMHSQNQRSLRKPPPPKPPSAAAREIRSSEAENYHNQHLFMQEDEMTSWLHYSIDEDPDPPFDHQNFCADMFYPPAVVNGNQNHNDAVQPAVTPLLEAPRPPNPPARRPEQPVNRIQNFAHFSKHNARVEPSPSSSSKATVRESTVVDSCETQVATATAAAVAAAAETVITSAQHTDTGRRSTSAAAKAVPPTASAGGRETATCKMTVTSSPDGSSGSAEPAQREPVADRKRKGREPEESEFQSEVCMRVSVCVWGFLFVFCVIPYALASAIVRGVSNVGLREHPPRIEHA